MSDDALDEMLKRWEEDGTPVQPRPAPEPGMPSPPPRPPWADEIVEIAKRMRRSGVRTDVIGRVGRELDELLRRIAEDGTG